MNISYCDDHVCDHRRGVEVEEGVTKRNCCF